MSALLVLLPGRVYSPVEVEVMYATSTVQAARTFTLQARRLPNELEFREMVATAATRAADAGEHPARRLVDLLVPF